MEAYLKFPIYAAGGQKITTDYRFNVPPFPQGITSFGVALSNKDFQNNFRLANPGVQLPPNHCIWRTPGFWNIEK